VEAAGFQVHQWVTALVEPEGAEIPPILEPQEVEPRTLALAVEVPVHLLVLEVQVL
jgi:hypothetical protein